MNYSKPVAAKTYSVNTRGAVVGRLGGDPVQRMYSTAKELIWRRRRLHKFPCNKNAVLDSLLPEAPNPRTVQWHNLCMALQHSSVVTVELNGQAGTAFWMSFNTNVVVPADHHDSFIMDDSNPHYEEVLAWWEKAKKEAEVLGQASADLYTFIETAKTPQALNNHWPELYELIKFDFKPSNLLSAPNLRAVKKLRDLISQQRREEIMELLASCTLLESYECDVWVGYDPEIQL